jgi:hypothetical protein
MPPQSPALAAREVGLFAVRKSHGSRTAGSAQASNEASTTFMLARDRCFPTSKFELLGGSKAFACFRVPLGEVDKCSCWACSLQDSAAHLSQAKRSSSGKARPVNDRKPGGGGRTRTYGDLEEIPVRQVCIETARAMVETWKDSWFEEGSRLIYIGRAGSSTTSCLSLSIQHLDRSCGVVVGRLEIVTPITARAVKKRDCS